MAAQIRIERVTRRFGRTVAVDGLTLAVEAGEIYAFLGPNGAGKTTTIKMMTGLLRPDEGRLEICGFDVQREGFEVRRRICYIPDQPYLYDLLSGREFLEFTGRLRGMAPAEIRRRTEELAELFGAGGFLDQPAHSYSHGMKQRVVLMAGLMHDPEVIILDEPMVGLDPRLIRRFKNVLKERTRRGATVFMSTHNLADAEEMADRIGIIHLGRLVWEGREEDMKGGGADADLESVFLRLTEEGVG
ncbi:MAG: ABC transporter ATP-binding protein [Planctomycetota bacterium]|nr:MAG: ABC transporter ATP-binding protein [Planctomycetota bacterium]